MATMPTQDEINALVAPAATHLDTVLPNWADPARPRPINLDLLDVGSARLCVLGQLTGAYNGPGTREIRLWSRERMLVSRQGVGLAHAFASRGLRLSADEIGQIDVMLTVAWTAEVTARRVAA